MTLKNLLLLFVSLLLLSGGAALAQQAPTPQTAPQAPSGPLSFSLLGENGNFLGILPEDVTRENMGRYGLREAHGVGITKVIESSPAARAGLKQGDVILRFDNEPVTSVRKLTRLIAEATPEQSVRLTISRLGSEQEISATLENGHKDFPCQSGDAPCTFEVIPPNRDSFAFAFGSQRRIGAITAQLTKQLADYFGIAGGRGVLVTSVNENSPAARAGLKAGDVITQVDGQSIETAADLSRAVNRRNEGEVTLTIVRDKSQRTVKLMPERRQAAPFGLPEGLVTPQVGQVVIPRIELPNIPERSLVIPRIQLQNLQKMNLQKMNIRIPRIDLPVLQKMNLVLPRIQNVPGVLLLPQPPI